METARGLPDGAGSGEEDSFFTYSDPNSPDKPSKQPDKKKTKNVSCCSKLATQ